MWELINEALQQSATRVITRVADFLPGVLAMIVAVLLAIFIGGAIRWALRRFLIGVRFDERVGQWGFPAIIEWSPSHSPTLLVARGVFWAILLLGALIGVSAFDARLTEAFAARLFTYLPNVIVAILLMLGGSFLARFLARGVLVSFVNMRVQSAHFISLGVKWLVIVLSTAMALDHLQIGGGILKLAFGILFGGIVLALALAAGLGSKDIVSRSWARQEQKRSEKVEEPFHHL
jgi:hypothetical protein